MQAISANIFAAGNRMSLRNDELWDDGARSHLELSAQRDDATWRIQDTGSSKNTVVVDPLTQRSIVPVQYTIEGHSEPFTLSPPNSSPSVHPPLIHPSSDRRSVSFTNSRCRAQWRVFGTSLRPRGYLSRQILGRNTGGFHWAVATEQFRGGIDCV